MRERDAGAAPRVVLRRAAVVATARPGRPAEPAGRRRRGRRERAGDPRPTRACCARSSTSAGTAGRRSCRSTPAAEPPAPCGAAALRCPYHSWTYDLDGRLLRAPHTEDVDGLRRRPPSACTPVAADTWGGFLFLHLRRRRPRRWPRVARCGAGAVARYPLDALVVGAPADLRRRAPTTRSCSRTTTSATTAPACTPSWCGWCRRSAAAAATSTGTAGIPHREGAWTFTAIGHLRPAARSPVSTTTSRCGTRVSCSIPNLMLSLSADHVAAFTLVADSRPGQTRIECDLLFAPDEVARDAFDPVRRGGLLGPRQPAGLGDLRVGAARHVLARLTRRAGSRRWRTPAWTSGAGCCRGWARPAREVRRQVERDTSWSGSVALGSATAWQLARRGVEVVRLEQFALGPRPRRVARHLADPAPQLPHARLRRAGRRGVRRLGDLLERESGEQLVTITGGVDLFPPGAAIPAVDYTTSMARLRCRRTSELDGAEVARALAGVCACPRAPSRSTRPTRRSCRPAGQHRDDAAARPRAAPGCTTKLPVTALRDRGTTAAWRSTSNGGRTPACAARRVRRAHRGRLDQRPAGPPRRDAAVDGDARAGDLLRAAGAGALRAGPAAGVDLDGRPVVLRLPDLCRGRQRRIREGGRGLRRSGDDGATPGRSTSTPARSTGCAASSPRCCRASATPARTVTCLYTLTPDRDFVARPGARASGRAGRPGRRARVQVRADVRAAAGRPGRRRLDDQRHQRLRRRPPGAGRAGPSASRWLV